MSTPPTPPKNFNLCESNECQLLEKLALTEATKGENKIASASQRGSEKEMGEFSKESCSSGTCEMSSNASASLSATEKFENEGFGNSFDEMFDEQSEDSEDDDNGYFAGGWITRRPYIPLDLLANSSYMQDKIEQQKKSRVMCSLSQVQHKGEDGNNNSQDSESNTADNEGVVVDNNESLPTSSGLDWLDMTIPISHLLQEEMKEDKLNLFKKPKK